MSKFMESLKHAIVEDEVPTTKTASHAGVAPSPVASVAPVAQEFHGDNGDAAYKKVLAKTDFASTPVALTIRKYLEPLAVITSMDEHTRFRTAVVQAKAQEGLTEDSIIGTFDGLKAALQHEQESFASALESAKQHEVASRQQQVDSITEQITSKQKELMDLQQGLSRTSVELADAQGKLQRAESQFKIAAQRRSMEIDQEKAKYVELLKG